MDLNQQTLLSKTAYLKQIYLLIVPDHALQHVGSLINQSINQLLGWSKNSIVQSINKSGNQPANQSINQIHLNWRSAVRACYNIHNQIPFSQCLIKKYSIHLINVSPVVFWRRKWAVVDITELMLASPGWTRCRYYILLRVWSTLYSPRGWPLSNPHDCQTHPQQDWDSAGWSS